MEYKMHRAIKISTGEVLEVSDVLANDPDMLLAYGFMLQPLPEEDITEELNTKFEESKEEKYTGEVLEVSENAALEYVPSETETKDQPAKRTYNKKK